MSRLNNQEITALIERLCLDMNLDLVDCAISRANLETQIDILADRPTGGITIEQCGQLNKKVCERLDTGGDLQDGYTVKVSSPGVDRPLRNVKDFQRIIGRPVRFYLAQKVANKLEHMGVVEEADGAEVVIKNNTESLRIPLELINKAIQEI